MARSRSSRLRRAARSRPRRIPPTPETLRKRRYDVIANLLAGGRIPLHLAEAAAEIRMVLEAVGRGMFPSSGWVPRIGKAPRHRTWRDFIDRMSARERRAWERHYIPWTREMSLEAAAGLAGTRRLQLVLDIVVDNSGLREAEQRYRLRHGTAIEYLIQGLERYHRRR